MTLFDAIEHGDLRSLRKMMRQGVDLQQIDEETGVAPLALAAEGGHLTMVRILLRAGADPDWGGAITPLEAAALEGHVDVVAALIGGYADVNRPVADGFTPLITAASTGNLEMVRVLLDAGAVLAVSDDEGETALSVAEKKGHKEIVEMLSAAKKNGNNGYRHRGDRRGGDNLFSAIEDRDATRLRELLKAREPDFKMRDRKGLTPLGRAAQTGHLALVRALLEGGAPVDEGGVKSPLHVATDGRYEPVVRVLLEAGADVNRAAGEERRTPLMTAAAMGSVEIVRLLLDQSADPKLHDHRQRDALWHAATAGQTQTFALLAAGFEDEERKAAEKELQAVIEARTRTATSAAQLIDLMHAGELGPAKQLLASGLIDPDGFDEEGRTALMIAAGLGRRDVVRMLIAAGASFELGDDENGWTALLHAIHSEAPDPHLMISLLSAAGANLNRPSTDGRTPLMHIVDVYLEGEEEQIEAFTTLANPILHLGADVEARDHDGKTAWGRVHERALDEDTSAVDRRKLSRLRRTLEKSGARKTGAQRVELLTAVSEGQLGRLEDLLSDGHDDTLLEELPFLSVAAANNNWDIVSYLVGIGVDINTPNRRGETILMQAAAAGLAPIIEQLLQVGADPSLKSDAGETAAALAAAAGHDELAAELKKAKKK